MNKGVLLYPLAIALLACNENKLPHPETVISIPDGFPEMEFPRENSYSYERWELGKLLFFDPILSLDSTVSCGSCHKPEYAFADNKVVSEGVEGRKGKRNSPSLGNIGYHPYFTREGGVPSLERQVSIPVEELHEMAFNLIKVESRIESHPTYRKMCDELYPNKSYYYAVSRALSVFERSLITGNSAYDDYKYRGESGALNEKEKNGMELFFSVKTDCSVCHSGFNFTNYSFENNGLYDVYPDKGRFELTRNQEDISKFKTPSLRNVAVTAPYMHDGSISTLEQVVAHYDKGGENNSQKGKSIRPLNLSKEEKENLVAFLKTLTDHQFINNAKFKIKE